MQTMSPDAPNLTELLRWRAARDPDRTAYIFLADGVEEAASISYGELDRQARAIAARLQRESLPGERALLLYPAGLDFIAAFFGCLYAGVVAVPVYPPKLNKPDPRFAAIVAAATPRFALATASILAKLGGSASSTSLGGVGLIDTTVMGSAEAGEWRPPAIAAHDLAFLQFTSGSTGTPRGVMVSHANVLANQRQIAATFGHSADSTVVSWLPRYHDTGLIGDTIQPLYQGSLSVFMAPVAFLQEPFRWLSAISRYRAQTSGAPNFAYELCLRQVTPEQRAALDLSCWTVAYNGAEPVRAETLERFARTFGPHGFRPDAFDVCYGMAETTLIVTGSVRGSGARVLDVDREALREGRGVAAPSSESTVPLVSCGRPVPGTFVEVVDPDSGVGRAPGAVGEVWVAGPSVAQGYWGQPDETRATFGATLAGHPTRTFLRTGDLGFLHDGELYITGRLKDLIIIRGRNLYPQDIEASAEGSHPAIRPGSSTAFAVGGAAGEPSGERLVLVAEVDRHVVGSTPVDAIAEAVRAAVAADHEVSLERLVLLRPGTLPRTSSGKLRRSTTRTALAEGGLAVIADWRAPVPVATSESPALGAAAGAPEVARWLRNRIAVAAGLDTDEVQDDRPFFAYGLDSLALTRVAFELEGALGRRVPAALFWEAPSIQAFAAALAGAGTGPEVVARPAAGDVASATALDDAAGPLTHGQAALWFLQSLAPETDAYHLAGAVRMLPAPSPDGLRAAFLALLARHDALRMRYLDEQGRPQQVPGPVDPGAFAVVDGAAWGEAELAARLAAEVRRPFDLERGPIARAWLVEVGPDRAVLLLVMHHLAGDYASLVLMMEELERLYAGRTLPAPGPSFLGWARGEADRLGAPAAERDWDYWSRALAVPPPVLDLPADAPRPPVRAFTGASQRIELPAAITERLRRLARHQGVSLHTLLLAAFQVLLARYAGQDAFAVGALTSGRTRPAAAGLVGYLVNPVAVLADVSGDQTFVEHLARVRDRVHGALAHQDLPFAHLVERLRLPRDVSRSPLFDVLFSLHQPLADGPGSPLAELLAPSPVSTGARWADLLLEPVALPQQEGQFDLALELVEGQRSIVGWIKYDTALFGAERVARLARHWSVLLEDIVDRPGAPVGALRLLDDAEQARLVVGVNATDVRLPDPTTLRAILGEAFERHGERVALDVDGTEATYDELWTRAAAVARALVAEGVGPDTLAGLFLGRTSDLAVALLGIVRAGAAWLPLDPGWPADRIRWLLADTGATVVVSDRATWSSAGIAAPDGVRVILVDELDDLGDLCHGVPSGAPDLALRPAPGPVRAPLVTADQLAYAIYTSGSTGQPKGVQVTQRAVVNLVAAMARRLGVGPGDRLAAVTPVTFDIAVLELLVPWVSGARVVLVGRADAADAERLATLLRRSRATIVQATPATWRLLVESGWRGDPGLVALSGGEALDRELADRLLERVGTLWNVYGPTETTIWSTMGRVERDEPISIGRPIDNTRVYVVDDDGRPVPVGVTGELWIGGAGVARGYLGRPDLDAVAFGPDPFSMAPGARIYRTGDLARWRADGTLEHHGRADHQVKVRGVRIEPAEVEAAVRAHPDVAEVVVTAFTARPGDTRLAAYVVARAGTALAAAELRRVVASRLPEAMVPASWTFLDALPLTAHGKVDRQSLPDPRVVSPTVPPNATGPAGRAPGPASTAPATASATASFLAATWAEILGVERVGLKDNVFELGGHSLLLVQVRGVIETRLGRRIPIAALFEHPTIESLAAYLDAGDGDPAGHAAAAPDRAVLRTAGRASAGARLEARRKGRQGGSPS